MVAQPAAEPETGPTGPEPWLSDPSFFTDIDRWCADLRELGPSATAKDALLRIRSLEMLNSAISAVQAREAVSLHDFRRREDADNGVPASRRGVYAGDEIALGKRVSPATGRKFLSKSRDLCNDLPRTYGALASGAIPESRAHVVAEGTAKLNRQQRKRVDEQLVDRLPQIGNRRLGREVRGLVQEITADTAAERADAAAENRHVSLKCLADGMARVSATVPMIQAVAVFDGLRETATSRKAGGAADGRTQNQLMADRFVELLTGQSSAESVAAEVHIVMEAESLFADGRVPAWLSGHGPLPAKTARNFLAANEARTFLSRLFTSPESGRLVSMDRQGRRFSGRLRQMIILRDDACRTPWCDAAIKHADHARSVAEGGATTWANASGLCAACNYAKEHPGWRHEASPESLTVITPTGEYSAADPPLVTKFRELPPGPRGTTLDGDEFEYSSRADRSIVEELFADQVLRDTG